MSKKQCIAAGIVLYNPDIERLKKCFDSLKQQVSKIFVFDNSEIQHVIQDKSVVYLSEDKNRGIAYALNCIMLEAQKNGFDWVVTMDQDSVVPNGLFEGFKSAIDQHPEVGIICPIVKDKRRSYEIVKQDNSEEFIEFCITSASCTSIQAWEKCGRFDDWLFIDLVDNDFCKRICSSGYKILQLKQFCLDQEFGKIFPKSEKIQKFWIAVSKILHNKNFAKFSYKKIVVPNRVYFTNRNIIYVNKKLKKYGPVGYENYNCKSYLGFIFAFMLPSILRAQNKKIVLKATLKGILDGIKSTPKEWSADK